MTKICSNCILTDQTPGIEFDENDVCNYCNTYTPMKLLGEQKLIELLDKYKKRNSKYDCMVGLSGGRDSTYTLWKLVKDYKMKVLGIHYNNPFTSQQAKKNMITSAEILDIDIINWNFGPNVHIESTKKALKIWSRNPTSTLIPIVCAHCKNWWPTIFKYARDNNVPLVVIGSNPLETASFKKKALGGARTYHKFSNIPNIIYNIIKQLVANPKYLTLSWPLVLSMYLGASHSSPYLKWRYGDISVIRLFDYIEWNEQNVLTTIQNNLGWEKSPEVESSWRFDCRLDYIRRFMYQSTIGVTELRDLFSKMIREGQITRSEALERLKKEDFVSKEIADDVLANLNMKFEDLNIRTENIR